MPDSLANADIYLSWIYHRLELFDEAKQMVEEALQIADEHNLRPIKILVWRCQAEYALPLVKEKLLLQALALAEQLHRPLDQVGSLLSLGALLKGKRGAELWHQGIRILENIGASAWLEGCSIDHPPQIVLAA